MGAYRDYLRNEYPEERTSAVAWMICAIIAGFILQNVLVRWFDSGSVLAEYLALSPAVISHFRLWTLFSYSLLHSPDNWLHILFVIVSLYFIGREVLAALGTQRFLALYAACTLAGGLTWLGAHWMNPDGMLFGASAAVTGLFFFFVCLFPNRPITFLFLFIPITLPKTKYLGYAVAFIDLLGFAFQEMTTSSYTVAHSAHLGGMLMGLGWYRFIHIGVNWSWPWRHKSDADIIPPKWAKKAAAARAAPGAFQVNLTERDRVRAEVDRILDKINSQGFGALTSDEKRTLDEARDMLNKR